MFSSILPPTHLLALHLIHCLIETALPIAAHFELAYLVHWQPLFIPLCELLSLLPHLKTDCYLATRNNKNNGNSRVEKKEFISAVDESLVRLTDRPLLLPLLRYVPRKEATTTTKG